MTNYPPGPQDPQDPQYPQYPQGQQYPPQYPQQFPQGQQYPPQYPQGQYPPYGTGPGMGLAVTAPPSILNAVKLMYAGAGISVLAAIINLFVSSGTASFKSGQIVGGLIGVALWLWMAQMNKRGQSWARILSTVLFGIFTLFFLAALALVGFPGAILSLIEWGVALTATILIWQKASSAYYNAPK